MGWFIVVGHSRSAGIVVAFMYKGICFFCKVGRLADQSRQEVQKCNEGTPFMKYVKNCCRGNFPDMFNEHVWEKSKKP